MDFKKEAKKNSSDPSKDAPFNMAVMYYYTLNNLIERKNNSLIEGDLRITHRYIQAWYNLLCFKMNQEERAKFRTELKKISNSISGLESKKVPHHIYYNVKNNCYDQLLDIDEKLMLFMDKHKMIFPRVDSMGGIDALRRKMNL